jgi:hypothetical protein
VFFRRRMLCPSLFRSRSGVRVGMAGVLLLLAQPAQAQNMMDNMIRKFCLQAVNKEVQASGKPAPAGMQDYTCNCVVQEMKKGQSQQQAAVTCKAAATRKFNL